MDPSNGVLPHDTDEEVDNHDHDDNDDDDDDDDNDDGVYLKAVSCEFLNLQIIRIICKCEVMM